MIKLTNILRATINYGIKIKKQEEEFLAGDIENFLRRKGFVCDVEVK